MVIRDAGVHEEHGHPAILKAIVECGNLLRHCNIDRVDFAVAPFMRLRFALKAEKTSTHLREGSADLEIGVLGEMGPEIRVRALFRDRDQQDELREPLPPSGIHLFELPVTTETITVSQMWHPRIEADPVHRWLRQLVLTVCRQRVPL